MIEQRPCLPTGLPGKWDTEAPGYLPRRRRWHASVTPDGTTVVRSLPVLTPGEDWSGYPPTYELTWEEWQASHETEYGLTITGKPTAEATDDRTAWRRIRRMAAGADAYDETSVRAAFAAVQWILGQLVQELDD